MNRIISMALMFCLVGMYVFAQDDSNTKSKTNLSDAKKYIKEMNTKMSSAMIQGDVKAMKDFYAEDAYTLPSYQPMMKGLTKIMENAKKEMDSGFKYNAVKFNTIDVFGDGDYVYEIGEYDITIVMPQAPQPVKDQGKYLTVWKKSGEGKWKVAADIWNSNNNPWMDKDQMKKGTMNEKESDQVQRDKGGRK